MRLSRSALVATLLATAAHADIFSPGDLSRQHAQLEGLSNCTQCHPQGGQLSQATCLNCHTELKPRVEKGLGFHGHLANDKRNCESCHPEHRGKTFEMVDWGPKGEKGFDHTRAAWPLEGKHFGLGCDKCHEKRRIAAAGILKLIEKKPERNTMLGVSRECRACHFDEHRGQEGDDCGACHDAKAWNPAPEFNHKDTNYPLAGKHLKVKCDGCHPSAHDEGTSKSAFPAPVSETFMKFVPIDHKGCLDCHKDFHDGKFGPRCQSCHVVEGWKIIRSASAERAFHDKTKFPLKGEHLDAACVACHGPFPGQPAKFKGLAFDQCSTCHADAHEGQLKAAKGAKAPDCELCHTVDRFMPPHYTIEQHQKTDYPLEGAHQVVPCNLCHLKAPGLTEKIPKAVHADLKRKKRPEMFSLVSFEITKPLEKCESCHQDVHKGQLAARACESCHQVSSFAKVKLNHDRDTRYPLTGKHVATPCAKCHGAPSPDRPVQYRPLPMICSSCHEDVHAAQFAANPKAPADCEKCHTTNAWKETKFLHLPPFTAYLLEGKHAEVKCEGCHRKVQLSSAVAAVRYRPLPQSCESCHSDFHQGSFKGFEP